MSKKKLAGLNLEALNQQLDQYTPPPKKEVTKEDLMKIISLLRQENLHMRSEVHRVAVALHNRFLTNRARFLSLSRKRTDFLEAAVWGLNDATREIYPIDQDFSIMEILNEAYNPIKDAPIKDGNISDNPNQR